MERCLACEAEGVGTAFLACGEDRTSRHRARREIDAQHDRSFVRTDPRAATRSASQARQRSTDSNLCTLFIRGLISIRVDARPFAVFLVLESRRCLSYTKHVSATSPKEQPEASSSGSARDVALKRILVPTDFSDSAAHALDYAIRLSRPYQAEILVVHVFHLQEYLALLSEKAQVDRGTANEVLEAAKRRALEMLEEVLHRFGDEQTVMIPILLFGVADEEIVKYSAEREVDLIVMPTHARTGLAHIFLGSTTERVISHAACPVVVVKRDEENLTQK